MKFVLLLFLLFANISFSAIQTVSNSKEFDEKVIHAKKPSLIKVSAGWCSACGIAKEPFKKIASDSAYSDIQFIELDFDQGKEIVARYSIDGVPTFLYIKNGELVYKESGAQSPEAFYKHIETTISRYLRDGEQKGPSVTEAPSTELGIWESISNYFSNLYESIKNYFK